MHVKTGLQNAYAEEFEGTTLNIFCVSNIWYEKYKHSKGTSDVAPRLVTTSGIPELRRFCYSLSTQSRFDEAMHFLRTTLPSILTSIGVHAKPESSAPSQMPIENLAKVDEFKYSV